MVARSIDKDIETCVKECGTCQMPPTVPLHPWAPSTNMRLGLGHSGTGSSHGYCGLTAMCHNSTGEKPSFLMFGVDYWSPIEAAFLPVPKHVPVDIPDYHQKLVLTLSSARELAQQSIRKAQQCYKTQYEEVSSIQLQGWGVGLNVIPAQGNRMEQEVFEALAWILSDHRSQGPRCHCY